MSDSNMTKDHYYAEMLNMMRLQGGKDNPTTIQIGVMQSSNSVKLDDLLLNSEDLYIADYLVKGYSRETTRVDTDTTATVKEKVTYTDGLKKGDKVALQKLDNNMYLILARVVRV